MLAVAAVLGLPELSLLDHFLFHRSLIRKLWPDLRKQVRFWEPRL